MDRCTLCTLPGQLVKLSGCGNLEGKTLVLPQAKPPNEWDHLISQVFLHKLKVWHLPTLRPMARQVSEKEILCPTKCKTPKPIETHAAD